MAIFLKIRLCFKVADCGGVNQAKYTHFAVVFIRRIYGCGDAVL